MPNPTLATVIVAAMLGIAATAAQADVDPSQRRLSQVETRNSRQDARIAAGTANGSINTAEAARLDSREARIDSSEARLASDGNFSRRDQARINARQNRASASIYRGRHNRR